MGSQIIPALVRTQVAFCCDEFSEGGVTNTIGVNAAITVGAAGVYDTFCSLIFNRENMNAAAVGAYSGVVPFTPGIDVNTGAPVAVQLFAGASQGFDFTSTKMTGPPHVVNADVTAVFEGGTPGANLFVWLRRNGVFTLGGGYVSLDSSGNGSVSFHSTFNFSVDYVELVVTGDGSGPVTISSASAIYFEQIESDPIQAWLDVYDQNGAFIRNVDHVQTFANAGTLVLGGHQVLPSGGELRAYVQSNYKDGVAITEGIMSLALAADDVTVKDCTGGTSGPSGSAHGTCSEGPVTTDHVSVCCANSETEDGSMTVTGSGTGTVTVSATFPSSDVVGDVGVTFDLEGPTSASGSGTIPVAGGSFNFPGLAFAPGVYSVTICFSGTGTTLQPVWSLSIS